MSLFTSAASKFAGIPCPYAAECTLGNCFYSHPARKNGCSANGAGESSLSESASMKPTQNSASSLDRSRVASTDSPPVSKKRRVNLPPPVPILVTNPPAAHPQRQQFVEVLLGKLIESGMSDDEAREKAPQIERDVAMRTTKFTYSMGIRSAVREIVTGSVPNSAYQNEAQMLRNELVNLLVPLTELSKRKYVLEVPLKSELASTTTLECARCASSFPIFHPTTKTAVCKFHLLKREYDPSTKRRSTVFPCCHQMVDESSGCESRPFHVYKLEEPSVMHGVLPFIKTPEPKPNGEHAFACGLDCEMAFTTCGFELIRITLVDYETRQRTFDRLVRPKGKILDLNTRFSGVSDMEEGILDENNERRMAITLNEMYTELFKIISAKTILVGHGLENDLHVLRLIHERIVDTAILLPRNKTRTYALKDLTWEYLGRKIQSGEHDSTEDALAAIDVIHKDIKTRCEKKTVKSFK